MPLERMYTGSNKLQVFMNLNLYCKFLDAHVKAQRDILLPQLQEPPRASVISCSRGPQSLLM